MARWSGRQGRRPVPVHRPRRPDRAFRGGVLAGSGLARGSGWFRRAKPRPLRPGAGLTPGLHGTVMAWRVHASSTGCPGGLGRALGVADDWAPGPVLEEGLYWPPSLCHHVIRADLREKRLAKFNKLAGCNNALAGCLRRRRSLVAGTGMKFIRRKVTGHSGLRRRAHA